MRFLVTGATSGVGMAVSRALREAGAGLSIWGRTRAILDDLVGEHDRSDAVAIDFERFPMCELTELVKERGPFDGIFHAAGSELVLPLRLTDDAKYRAAMTFADSTFAILRAAATKGVVADGGSVVIMSSVAAHRGTPGMGPYGAARAAAEGLMRVAARELAARRVRVNCVAAGAFKSPMHARVTGRMPETAQTAYMAAHPLGFGTVDAVRDAVLHLLSPASAWTTGTVMVVDGGYLAA